MSPRKGRPPADPSRKKEMERMRADGFTVQEIANHFGLSKQRVSQIIGGDGRKPAKPAVSGWEARNHVLPYLKGDPVQEKSAEQMIRTAASLFIYAAQDPSRVNWEESRDDFNAWIKANLGDDED